MSVAAHLHSNTEAARSGLRTPSSRLRVLRSRNHHVDVTEARGWQARAGSQPVLPDTHSTCDRRLGALDDGFGVIRKLRQQVLPPQIDPSPRLQLAAIPDVVRPPAIG